MDWASLFHETFPRQRQLVRLRLLLRRRTRRMLTVVTRSFLMATTNQSSGQSTLNSDLSHTGALHQHHNAFRYPQNVNLEKGGHHGASGRNVTGGSSTSASSQHPHIVESYYRVDRTCEITSSAPWHGIGYLRISNNSQNNHDASAASNNDNKSSSIVAERGSCARVKRLVEGLGQLRG